MADKDAKISVGVEGTDEVARSAERALRPWTNAATTAQNAMTGFGRAVGDVVRQTTSDIARGVTAFAAFDFSSRIPAVIQYREEVARLSVVTGTSSDELRRKFAAQEAQTLQARQANEEFAKSFGRITYNYRQSADAASALADEALAANRSLGEMAGVGKVIYDATGKISAAPEVLGRIRAQAEKLGTIGGPDALRDQFERMGAVVARLSTQTPEQLGRLTGALGAIGKGLRPEQAAEAQQSIFAGIFGDTKATERFLRSAGELKKGESILDSHGQIKDPAAVLAAYQRAWRKEAGSMPEAQRLARMYFGDIGGASFMRAQFEQTDGMSPSEAARVLANNARATEELERKRKELAARGGQSALAEQLLPAVDATMAFAATHPLLANLGALFGPGMLDKAIGAGLGAGGGVLGTVLGLRKAGLIGKAGARAATMGVDLAGTAGSAGIEGLEVGTNIAAESAALAGRLGGGALSTVGRLAGPAALIYEGLKFQAHGMTDIGEDTATTGRKWREGHGGVQLLEAYSKAAKAAENAYDEDAPMVAYRAARSAGASKEDAEEIARAIFDKVQSKPPVIQIINKTGGPIEAVTEQNADPSGAQ